MQAALLEKPGVAGEELLLAQARAGNEAAVRALMAAHNRRLFRLARGILRDHAEAEDVVQATYVKAFTSLAAFRGDAALATWLTRIALNEALGRLRRRRPTIELSDLDTEAEGARVIVFPHSAPSLSPEAEAARRQVREVLEEAIGQLPDPFRVVFVLRDVEGLSTEEVAASVGILAETVKTRLHRARKLMRAAIEKAVSPCFSELFPFGGHHCAQLGERVIAALRAGGPFPEPDGEANDLRIKRAYEPAAPGDGTRVLVDRLWPRGVTKAAAHIDVWAKDVAPSPALRRWFGHDPAKWEEFRARYAAELESRPEALAALRRLARAGTVTLVYAARDERHNGAIVLRDLLC